MNSNGEENGNSTSGPPYSYWQQQQATPDNSNDENSPQRHYKLTRRTPYKLVFTEINGPDTADDEMRKREIRRLKNRESARDSRRRKREYIEFLENRVLELENENKTIHEKYNALKEAAGYPLENNE